MEVKLLHLSMKVISVNRGDVKTVSWRGKDVKTGIFKYPANGTIYLGIEDVKDDAVVDRRFHGGIDKAVYAYSYDHYPYWKEKFPDADWDFGMFGENLTIENMNEDEMNIGAIYQVGDAEIQVCQPRQPCFKLGIRFNTQSVLKTFVNSSFSGVYFRVLKSGRVNVGDDLNLIFEEPDAPSIKDVYELLYHKKPGMEKMVESILNCNPLPKSIKESVLHTQA